MEYLCFFPHLSKYLEIFMLFSLFLEKSKNILHYVRTFRKVRKLHFLCIFRKIVYKILFLSVKAGGTNGTIVGLHRDRDVARDR